MDDVMEVELSLEEIELLAAMVSKRIIDAAEAGVSPNDSSSRFRESLINKLLDARRQLTSAPPAG
jgi:hypothetical protein